MSIIIFIIILSLLIIVHELGHFLVARLFGIRVDEFGLGFPPRAVKLFTWKDTPFTLNWLPFGGFVKIFGENPESTNLEARPPSDSFQAKNRGIQGVVLVAGVVGNFVFAWLLFSLGFMIGLPVPGDLGLEIEKPQTVITQVVPDSPADAAGLKSGDTILYLVSNDIRSETMWPDEFSTFISESKGPVVFRMKRGQEFLTKIVVPQEGIVEGKIAVGISMDLIGTAKFPVHKAIWNGLKITGQLTVLTAQALGAFISQAVVGKADLSSVTGPVGIVGVVGDTLELGFVYLLTFTALISINLSIINLLPFPALDGGRLLFVIIEAVTRRSIPARVFNVLNTAGFAILILLMILITTHDIKNIL